MQLAKICIKIGGWKHSNDYILLSNVEENEGSKFFIGLLNEKFCTLILSYTTHNNNFNTLNS